MHSQVVVLGGGPGGYAAAFLAADLGMEVAIVEADPRLGGTCLLRGCIPSKALLHVAKVISEAREMTEWGVDFGSPKVSIEKVRKRKEQVIATLTGGLAQLAKRRNVKVVNARGVFVDSQTLQLEGGNPATYDDGRITFDHCILATGSTPAMPKMFQIKSDRVMDSTGALELVDAPATLLVVGGGYIGLEMGSVYAELGTKVSVVELLDGLLPGADRDLVKPLEKRLRESFESIMLSTKVLGLQDVGGKVEVEMEGPDGAKFKNTYDRVLVSVGRRPKSTGFGLENTKVTINEKGFVEIDEQQRTSDPHIFAIGDVAGEPMLAHKASHEARVAVEAIEGQNVAFEPAAIPAVVFTDPEIAWAGLTETEAQKTGRKVEIARFPWAASGRAITLDRTDGVTKLVIDPETERILGVGICGPGAGELISEGVLAIEMAALATDLKLTIHPHPTTSETVMEAAEIFFGQATHVYRPKKKS